MLSGLTASWFLASLARYGHTKLGSEKTTSNEGRQKLHMNTSQRLQPMASLHIRPINRAARSTAHRTKLVYHLFILDYMPAFLSRISSLHQSEWSLSPTHSTFEQLMTRSTARDPVEKTRPLKFTNGLTLEKDQQSAWQVTALTVICVIKDTRLLLLVYVWHICKDVIICLISDFTLASGLNKALSRLLASAINDWVIHVPLNHISLQLPSGAERGEEKGGERQNDGDISGFQPCCQCGYEQPLLGRACLKPNSTTSLKASGSPAGLHSVPCVTTNFPSKPFYFHCF